MVYDFIMSIKLADALFLMVPLLLLFRTTLDSALDTNSIITLYSSGDMAYFVSNWDAAVDRFIYLG